MLPASRSTQKEIEQKWQGQELRWFASVQIAEYFVAVLDHQQRRVQAHAAKAHQVGVVEAGRHANLFCSASKQQNTVW
jgi:hypothetical protein